MRHNMRYILANLNFRAFGPTRRVKKRPRRKRRDSPQFILDRSYIKINTMKYGAFQRLVGEEHGTNNKKMRRHYNSMLSDAWWE